MGRPTNYAQQVDVQLACKLGVPVTTAAVEITPADAGLVVAERTLEDVVETVELPHAMPLSRCCPTSRCHASRA